MILGKQLSFCVFSMCVMTSGMAWAGSGPAQLSCMSESGKVELSGKIPATEEALDLTLKYNGFILHMSSSEDTADVTTKFRKGIFKLNVSRSQGDDLLLESVPKSVVIHELTPGSTSAEFVATLRGPRPGGEKNADETSMKPLKTTMKCRYEYSI